MNSSFDLVKIPEQKELLTALSKISTKHQQFYEDLLDMAGQTMSLHKLVDTFELKFRAYANSILSDKSISKKTASSLRYKELKFLDVIVPKDLQSEARRILLT